MSKKLIYLVLVALPCLAGNAAADIPAGALAIYCFGTDGTTDLSGNGNNASLAFGASIGGDGLLHFNNGAIVPSGVIGTMGSGGAWTLYLKQFSGTVTAEMTSIVCIGSDGRRNSIVLYQRGGNFETDIWYENMDPVSSSVNFHDGAARDWFITYDGNTWRLYNGTAEVGSGGLSYSGFGGGVYIGTPDNWPEVQDDMYYNAPNGTVQAMAIYGRVLNATERANLVDSICDRAPKVEFVSESSGNLETVSPATVTVALSNPQEGQTYGVSYSVSGGTATRGVDYTLADGTLTFTSGQTTKTININIINDDLDEEDETIIMTLSNPTGSDLELGEIMQHTYTIIDPRPSVGFDSAESSELEDVGAANIAVILSAASSEMVTVDYAITGGTATNSVDYTLNQSGTLTFSPGQTVKNLAVTIVADELEEDNETIVLRLSNWTNAKPGYTQHTFTIRERGISALEGAYYRKLNSGQGWESASRTGPYADVEVCFEDPQNKFVFWRASSYLPYWKTAGGMWYVQELVPRSGDGSGLMPDKVNQYSHVRVIESSKARVIVHWRYVPNFSNPDFDGWVDEYYTIYPDGVCIRTIRRGAARLDNWLDPSNLTIQNLKLEPDGITTLPASWQSVPQLLLSGSSATNYDHKGFDEARRCYVLRCRKNATPSTLDFTLDTAGGKSIHHPVIVVKNWGDAGVAVAIDGQKFTRYKAGYANHTESTDLILWLGKSSASAVAVSITPKGGTAPANRAPVADAGEDQSILVSSGASGPYVVNLEGIAEDDGLPNDNLTATWSKVTGPGSANFGDSHNPATSVSLSTDGTYQLRLTASDGSQSAQDDVIVVIKKDPGVVGSPVAWWKFNEGSGDTTAESIAGRSCNIGGDKSLWKAGVSGTALQFDGYNSVVRLPSSQAPSVSDGLTVEAWTALGARPWNWAPIVHQSNWQSRGYYLGVDAYGHLGFMVSVGGSWQTLTTSATLPRYKWAHVVGTFDRSSGRMYLYMNGSQVGSRSVSNSSVSMASTELLIGRNNTAMRPTDAVRDYATLPTLYGFDGLIDEVKIYNRQLSSSEVSNAYNKNNPSTPVRDNPAMQERILPGLPTQAQFGAYYGNLRYYETWDNMWRVSEHPDVIVKFDQTPGSVVFWRGTTFGSGWVSENNKWISHQSIEEGADEVVGCAEHMSDKQCRHSHVRIIESTDARVVVHWRYALVDILYNKPRLNSGTGWSDWVDEYYTIYPDGVGIRNAKYWSSEYGHYSPQAAFFLNPPGVRPEETVSIDALIVANPSGQTRNISWAVDNPHNPLSNANIEIANLKSTYKPFVIYEESVHIWAAGGGDEKTDYTPWLTFNHFPAAQILSDGRKARDPDHLTHSALSEIDVDDLNYDIYMYGLTNSSASSLVPLSRSWNNAPSISTGSGLSSQGYDRGQRAYMLQLTSPGAKTLQFTLNGSSGSPIVNPCFVIKNWQSNAKVSLAINGQPIAAGPNFRRGIENSANGAVPSLVIWIKKQSTSPITVTITKEEIPGDFDNDCDVDEVDLAALVSHWLDTQPGCHSLQGDLNSDCGVDFKDFTIFAAQWQEDCL